MVEVIEHLLEGIESAKFTLNTPDAHEARERRDRVAAQLRNHLLPRLRQVSAPLLVVVGGSTGAGKSTLVNSVVGEEVSTAGVLRPTTREPVLITHPKDAELLEQHPVLELARLQEHENVARGVAVLDAPDLDSVYEANRSIADKLIELADLWVFVTSGTRYGDAVPWARLQEADERGVSLAVALNRVNPDSLAQIRADLFTRMNDHGFGSVPYFVIPDVGPHEGVLDAKLVAEFAAWISVIGKSAQSRSVIARTVRGAWPALRHDVLETVAALETQRRTELTLNNQIGAAPTAAANQVSEDVAEGAIGYGGPTTTWLAGATSGGPLAALANPSRGVLDRWRARRSADARGMALSNLRRACNDAAAALIADAAARGERAIRDGLNATDAGKQVMYEVRQTHRLREARMRNLLSEWNAQVKEKTAPLTSNHPDLATAAIPDLIGVAAVGLDGPRRAVARILGEAGTDVVDSLQADLAEWASAAVRAEAEEYQDALDNLDIDPPTAPTSLRLRASELKGFE